MHRKRVRFSSDGTHTVSIHTKMDVDPMVQGVKMMSDAQLQTPTKDRQGRLYLGSIDPLTAQNWAKECGHPAYSKEWREYSLKKLRSGEFSHFKAEQVRKYV